MEKYYLLSGRPISNKKRKRTSIVINGDVTIVNINTTVINNNFNVPYNTDPVLDIYGNKYVTTESGNMTHQTLIQFISEIIIKHTDGAAAALFLDSLGYQHNDGPIEHGNINNITVNNPIQLNGYNY